MCTEGQDSFTNTRLNNSKLEDIILKQVPAHLIFIHSSWPCFSHLSFNHSFSNISL